jgi:hypothetical protein
MLGFVDQSLITRLLDIFTKFMYNTNEKNIQKNNFSSTFWGRSDSGESVGKGKPTKFYFRRGYTFFDQN